MKSLFEGLASSYLHALHRRIPGLNTSDNLSHATAGPDNMLADAGLFAQIRKSKFKLPALGSHPMVMVANGTGIARFRAFIAERYRLARLGKPIGKMLLVFGCRGEEDFLYREEIESWERREEIESWERQVNAQELKFTMVTAFSRQAEECCYVQKCVRESDKDIYEMLEGQRANFHLCGSATMAREVGKNGGRFSIHQGMGLWRMESMDRSTETDKQMARGRMGLMKSCAACARYK